MADFNRYFSKLLKQEGTKYVNHPLDKGGATKFGVTLNTWRVLGWDKDGDGVITNNDIKLLTIADARYVAKTYFWDAFEGDRIKNQSIAEIIIDWSYGSGVTNVKNRIAKILGKGVSAFNINRNASRTLFSKIKNARISFYYNIVKAKPSQQVFLKGWLRRVNGYNYEAEPNMMKGALIASSLCCLIGLTYYGLKNDK